MKIVITEAGTAKNVGSMALIENAIRIARTKYPKCAITLFCLDSISVSKALEKDGMIEGVKVLNDLFPVPNGSLLKKIFWFLHCIIWILYSRFLLLFCKKISWAFCGRKKINLKEIENADYIYCIGAERINDIYFKTALLSLYAIGTYIKMGKKLIHFSLTIGPVFNNNTIRLAKKILNGSYAIFVRDSKSFELLKDWKCKAPFIFNSYDIALLQNLNVDKEQSLIKEFNIKENFIGVSCIYWLFRKATGPVRQNEYEKTFAEILDYLVEKYDYQIVFTPTVVGVGQYDDVFIGKRIIQKMKNQNSVVSIERLLTPIEMATMFSLCKFSIVTRMHAAILCSGAGHHPIIAINYLYKLREYMKNIDFEDYSIDIDFVDFTTLKKYVDKLMNNYEYDYERLLKRQENIRKIINRDLTVI